MITIIGGSGFVGKNLVQNFKAQQKAFNVLSLRANKIFPQFDCDVVIHLGGKAHDLKNVSDPAEYYVANTELTAQVFEEFLRSNAKKFIFLSSVKAVADMVTDTLSEDVVPHPATHYGKSKLRAEEYILSKTLPIGKSIYILRPCMIHGPGNKGNLNLLYKIILKGFPWPLGSFQNKRSFLSIQNLCFTINNFIERDDIESGVYHVADDDPLSTNQLISIMAKEMGKTPVIWNIPKFIIKALAKAGDFFHLPLNSERLVKLTENFIVSNQKLKMALRKELPISSEKGIATTIHSFDRPSNVL